MQYDVQCIFYICHIFNNVNLPAALPGRWLLSTVSVWAPFRLCSPLLIRTASHPTFSVLQSLMSLPFT